MVFSSSVFLLAFLPAVFLGNLLVGKRLSNGFLLAASLLFYAWGEPFLVLVMLLSIAVNWLMGRLIARTEGGGKRLLLALDVAFNLAILGYYKYAGFIVTNLNAVLGRELMPVPAVRLPIGISFFTFQAISYVVDVYRRETEAAPRLVSAALYIAFFPQLIAGPIVKYRDINRQIEARGITWTKAAAGFRRFIYGLSKKVLISNVLGLCADTVFGRDVAFLDGRAAWIGAVAYALQIYYDFSGYSDMAIGLAKMFGFDLLENFDYPYLSRSITEFWRRWHISLGSWFREYVYFPLGGNRKGKARTYLNLLVVFFLTGLWHGAAWSFVAWGLYHGLFMILERMGLGKRLEKGGALSLAYCLLVVLFGWVLFRAEGLMHGARYLARMAMPWRFTAWTQPVWEYLDIKTIAVAACAVLGLGGLKKRAPAGLAEWWKGSVPEALYCVALLVLSLAAIAGDTYNPFIYFQF